MKPSPATLLYTSLPALAEGSAEYSAEGSAGGLRPRPMPMAHDPRVLRSLPKTGKRGAPQAFPHLLYLLLEREAGDVVRWTATGRAFEILDLDRFIGDTLVKYFRHSRYASFQRQLNLYGFRKNDDGHFEHESFLRRSPELLTRVLRAPQSSKGRRKPSAPPPGTDTPPNVPRRKRRDRRREGGGGGGGGEPPSPPGSPDGAKRARSYEPALWAPVADVGEPWPILADAPFGAHYLGANDECGGGGHARAPPALHPHPPPIATILPLAFGPDGDAPSPPLAPHARFSPPRFFDPGDRRVTRKADPAVLLARLNLAAAAAASPFAPATPSPRAAAPFAPLPSLPPSPRGAAAAAPEADDDGESPAPTAATVSPRPVKAPRAANALARIPSEEEAHFLRRSFSNGSDAWPDDVWPDDFDETGATTGAFDDLF